MNAIQKFWLGFFTFLPIIFVLIFFGFFFTVFLGNIEVLENNHGEFPKEFMQSFAWFIMLIILMAITGLGIRIYYIVHTNNNKENDANKKIMWTLLLIFVGTVASIIYYFVEIIPSKPIEKL
jgi:magnesium-transporting ATPase (P-type)